jgi:hypothetical protein
MKHKVPPLRFAPVGMTDLFSKLVFADTCLLWAYFNRGVKGVFLQECHHCESQSLRPVAKTR